LGIYNHFSEGRQVVLYWGREIHILVKGERTVYYIFKQAAALLLLLLIFFLSRASFAQDKGDIYSEDNMKLLGSSQENIREIEKKKFLEDVPDVNILKLRDLFDDGNTQFKLEAIDIFEAYGANSLFSYDTLSSATCDPNPDVRTKALKILGAKSVKPEPCDEAQPSSTLEIKPSFNFENTQIGFDHVVAILSFHNLKPETHKLVLDLTYSPNTIQLVGLEKPRNAVLVKQSEGFCRYEFKPVKTDLFYVYVKLKPSDASSKPPGFWDGIFSKSRPKKSVYLLAEAQAVSSLFSKDSFPVKELNFEFFPPGWVIPGEKIIQAIKNKKDTWLQSVYHGSVKFGDFFAGPDCHVVSLGVSKESLLIATTEIMKSQGGEEINVYRKVGNDYEIIFKGGSRIKGGYEVFPWKGENALLIHDNQGRLYFLRNGKFKKVFEYPDSGCVYQGGCSFETKLATENNKLYLYRRETLNDHPSPEDLLKEARWRKASVIWNERTGQFQQEGFKLAYP
jgi:hypothetical protein